MDPFYDTLVVKGGLMFLPRSVYSPGSLPALESIENTTHFCFSQIHAPVSVAKHPLSVKYPLCQMTS
jgi:hypothetical protein